MNAAWSLLMALAWRNLWRNPRRAAITAIVVAAGLFSVLTLDAMMQAWAQSSRDATLELLTGSGQIHAQGWLDDPVLDHRMPAPSPELSATLNAAPIGGWASRVTVPAVIQSEYKTLPLSLMGVDPASEARISTIPDMVVEGSYLTGPDDGEIVLGRHLLERLRTQLGRRVIVMAQAADGTLAQRGFVVAGVFAGNTAIEDGYAFTGQRTVQQMLGIGSDISEIAFRVPDNGQLGAAVTSLKAAAPELDVKPWTALSPMAAAMDSAMGSYVWIWLGIVFVLMAIGIVNTQLMAVFERVREFGLLMALGMKPRLILALVCVESALLVGLGVAVGFVASAALTWGLSGGVDLGGLAQGAEYFGGSRMLYPHFDMALSLREAALIWALGVLVALWPAARAARANPVEAMSHET
ncbi:MAG: FtsX-like permease family protein [Limimaricola sp.]|uniref:ABC transporter permease n=1 Tax=Limimaricola sp. TaxID=2211665 RepID=UPI001DDA86F0|nr:FtsX-like permease family protein [Limimaricola sp.]MBI1418166.1 FtsX-like permease family protein [Limimaricola sp.]